MALDVTTCGKLAIFPFAQMLLWLVKNKDLLLHLPWYPCRPHFRCKSMMMVMLMIMIFGVLIKKMILILKHIIMFIMMVKSSL